MAGALAGRFNSHAATGAAAVTVRAPANETHRPPAGHDLPPTNPHRAGMIAPGQLYARGRSLTTYSGSADFILASSANLRYTMFPFGTTYT